MLIIEKVEKKKTLLQPNKISDSSDQDRDPNKIPVQYKDALRETNNSRKGNGKGSTMPQLEQLEKFIT